MNSPRPCSYHQKETAVAMSSASSALKMRLRSSVRWATRVIVAWASRGWRRRRTRDLRPSSVTVGLPLARGSELAVGRAGLFGAGARLGRADLGDPGLLVQLRGQVAARRGGRRHDLAAQRGAGLGGVLGADVLARVVVLHALHLALEDPQRAAERARG